MSGHERVTTGPPTRRRRRPSTWSGQARTKPLVGLAELADLLAVHRSTIYRAVERGTLPLPIVRIGSRMTVPRAAVDRLLAGVTSAEHPIQCEGHDVESVRVRCPSCGSGLEDPVAAPATRSTGLSFDTAS